MPAKKRKKHTRYNGGVIRPRGSSYQAEYSRNGNVHRKQFPNAELCRAWIDAHAIEHEQHTAPPSMAEIIEAREARALLPASVSLITAARAYLAAHPQMLEAQPLSEVIAQFLADKAAANIRPRSMQNLRAQVNHLADVGADTAAEITPPHLRRWLDERSVTGWTRDGYRRSWSNFFEWCIRNGHAASNPAKAITAITSSQRDPSKHILAPAQAAALIRAARETDSDLLPYLALKLFAGLRTSEAQQITWDCITPGYIRVSPEVAKMRRQRLIPIREACRTLLGTPGKGRVCPFADSAMQRHLNKLHQTAEVPQHHNAMRDSWITYRIAETGDVPTTAQEAGNSASVTLQSYRDLATRQAAAAYFRAHQI